MTTTVHGTTTTMSGRPAFEGANIRTWVGFKHFLYLVEGAVLQWLREQGSGPSVLYHEHGLGVEIVDCSVQLPAVLDVDDEVAAQVVADGGRRLAVALSVVRDGRETIVLRGRVVVALVPERAAARRRPAPGPLSRFEVADLDAACPAAGPAADDPAEPFRWSWRAPYYYCHYSDRVQHSGYVRALEEVVDRFLADRGISVGRLLAERDWIPVVSRVRVQVVGAAHLEEVVHTEFRVLDVLRETLFDARMDCHVLRDGVRVPVATARILHGYAVAAGPAAGGMAELDADVVRALIGAPR